MPLKGIRVVEFAGLAPGPFCGMVLADFGASVIRIDKPNNPMEKLDFLSNGKKSLCLDLKSPKAVQIIRKLIKTSDVSIDPFRPGTMEKLGLGPDVLTKDNPRLIYSRLTGYGQSGPYALKAGHDINYLALTGLLSLFGRKNENPIFPANLAADFGGGGLMCVVGILIALLERERSGLGQVIDANMVEGTSYLGSYLYRTQSSPIWGNKRGENILDSGAPFYEVYKTKDAKYVAVAAIEPQFYQDLLKGLGLTEDEAPQFEFEANKALFSEKFAQKTRDEWIKIFEGLDACVGPVLELDEVNEDVHNKSQGTFTKDGDVLVPRPAPHLNRTPAKGVANFKRPNVGGDTFSILKDIGYSDKDIGRYQEEGVIEIEKLSKL